MSNGPHKHPHYAIRIPELTMDKLKYIAGHNGHSVNKKIGQLILAHISAYEDKFGEIRADSRGL